MREGAPNFDTHGHKLGKVTSGTLGPTINKPIAMAYLPADHACRTTRSTPRCGASGADARRPDALPPHRYYRG